MAFTHPENVIINQAAPFTGRLVDVQLSGASKAYVDQDGNVFINGNVGIGTASPSAKLHVVGNTFLMSGSVGINTTNPQERLDVRQTGAGGTVGVRIGGDGASVANYLDIYGSDAASTQMSFRLRTMSPAPGQSRFDILNITQSTDARFSIDNAGNVGIGTQTPTAKLDVAGSVKASGNISSGVSADIAISAGRRLYFNGLGGTRYLADNTVQNCIDFAGNLAVGGGFRREPVVPVDLGLTIDEDGTVSTNGNLRILRTGIDGDPTLVYLGRQGWHYNDPPTNQQPTVPLHTNYFFWQNRLNQNGWYWSGWNTFRHPATVKKAQPTDPDPKVEWGYGYYPFRNMAKNALIEADGKIVTDNEFYGPIIYFQKTLHIDVIGEIVTPPPPDPPYAAYKTRAADGYDSDRHPYYDLVFQTSLDGPVSAGSNPIVVASSGNFAVGDEIFIDEQVAPPGNPRSEINEILSISGSSWTLKRDHKNYSSGKPVKKVRELGGVQPDTSAVPGHAIYIRFSGNDLIFKDNRGNEITLDYIRTHLN